MSDKTVQPVSTPPGAVQRAAGAVRGRFGKMTMVGVFFAIVVLMACSCPFWLWVSVRSWWGDNERTPITAQPDPAAGHGIDNALIQCGSDEWVMSWWSEGKEHFACTPKWE